MNFRSIAIRRKVKAARFFERNLDVESAELERVNLGHVRQLVDSLPYKEEVRGSSPFMPTSKIENYRFQVTNLESLLRSRSSVG